MADKMKAVVKTRPELGGELLERPLPKIAPDQVLVKVRATSICGTDVHIYKWDAWAANRIGEKRLPQIMGHEVAGEVVEVGGHVKRVKVGDYISAETHIYDPGDLTALLGQLHIGDHMKILGVDCDGAFAEYFAVPESVCWINDASIPPELATIQEPLGNAVYTVLGEDFDVAGKTVVILGDGPAALLAAGVARVCGMAKIFIVGKYEFNLKIAQTMGADFPLYANKDDVDRVAFVKDHTYGAGADIVLDMAGSPQALTEGFKMLRRGGRFSASGIAADSPTLIDYNRRLLRRGPQGRSRDGVRRGEREHAADRVQQRHRLQGRPDPRHQRPAHVRHLVPGAQPAGHRPPRHPPGDHPHVQPRGLREGLRRHAGPSAPVGQGGPVP